MVIDTLVSWYTCFVALSLLLLDSSEIDLNVHVFHIF